MGADKCPAELRHRHHDRRLVLRHRGRPRHRCAGGVAHGGVPRALLPQAPLQSRQAHDQHPRGHPLDRVRLFRHERHRPPREGQPRRHGLQHPQRVRRPRHHDSPHDNQRVRSRAARAPQKLLRRRARPRSHAREGSLFHGISRGEVGHHDFHRARARQSHRRDDGGRHDCRQPHRSARKSARRRPHHDFAHRPRTRIRHGHPSRCAHRHRGGAVRLHIAHQSNLLVAVIRRKGRAK